MWGIVYPSDEKSVSSDVSTQQPTCSFGRTSISNLSSLTVGGEVQLAHTTPAHASHVALAPPVVWSVNTESAVLAVTRSALSQAAGRKTAFQCVKDYEDLSSDMQVRWPVPARRGPAWSDVFTTHAALFVTVVDGA